jgi:hypothetical protein
MTAAAEVLILIGENGGDPIFALIAIGHSGRASRRRHLHCAVSVRSGTRSFCDHNPDGPPIDEADHFYRTGTYSF